MVWTSHLNISVLARRKGVADIVEASWLIRQIAYTNEEFETRTTIRSIIHFSLWEMDMCSEVNWLVLILQ